MNAQARRHQEKETSRHIQSKSLLLQDLSPTTPHNVMSQRMAVSNEKQLLASHGQFEGLVSKMHSLGPT